MIELEHPELGVIEFPDGTPPDAMKHAVASALSRRAVEGPKGPGSRASSNASRLSTGERFVEGIKSGVSDIGLGWRQAMFGGDLTPEQRASLLREAGGDASRVGNIGADLDREAQVKRARDAQLGTAGTVGKITGAAVAAAPLMAVPGANTVGGAALAGAGLGALQPVVGNESRAVNAGTGAVLGAGGQKIGGYAGALLNRIRAGGAAKAAQNAPRDAALTAFAKEGGVIPPSTTNPTLLNKALESTGGKALVQNRAKAINQGEADRIVREELGIPSDMPLSLDTLKAHREVWGKAYKDVSEAGDMLADDTFRGEVQALTPKPGKLRTGGGLSKDSLDILEKLKGLEDVDASELLEAAKEWRGMARDLYTQAATGTGSSTSARANAFFMDGAVDAVEDLLERNLARTGRGELADKLKLARSKIALSHSVEKSLVEGTGHIDPRKFAPQVRKGVPLPARLKMLADAANNNPKAFGPVTESNVTVADALLAGAGGVAAGPVGVALPLVRRGAAELALRARNIVPSYGPGRATSAGLGAVQHGAGPAGLIAAQDPERVEVTRALIEKLRRRDARRPDGRMDKFTRAELEALVAGGAQ